LHHLTQDHLTYYHTEGYLPIPNALPPDLLALSQTVLERWVDETINGWVREGLIDKPHSDLDFHHRLVQVWHAAGKPGYIRSPRRDLVCREMYDILVHSTLLDLAEYLLGTDEISVHGIFNGRPKLPDQIWTDTPWHQDAQYYRDAEHIPVVSMWFPLQRVTEQNSCLQMASRLHRTALHEGYDDLETGFRGLAPEVRDTLKGISIEMAQGDLVCFTQKTPHRALPNRSDRVRWSIDVRYEATANATASGKDKGFIARSPGDPGMVVSYEGWLKKWEGLPGGTY